MTTRCASRRQRSLHMRPPRDGGRLPKKRPRRSAKLRRVLYRQAPRLKTRRAKLPAARRRLRKP